MICDNTQCYISRSEGPLKKNLSPPLSEGFKPARGMQRGVLDWAAPFEAGHFDVSEYLVNLYFIASPGKQFP